MKARAITAPLAAVGLALFCGLAPSAARAAVPALSPPLLPLQFMLGEWAGEGKTENGTSRGASSIHPIVGGGAILRRDHTDLFGPDGKPAGGFDQIMFIYGEQGQVHADYLDGQHVIHYLSATVGPGESVAFLSDERAAGPAFRLSYRRTGPERLHVTFALRPPGQPAYITVADGDLHATAPQ